MPFVSKLLAVTLLLASLPPASAEPLFGRQAICRTAIASIMDRDPKAVQITRTSDAVLLLTFVRPIDNFVWTYRCRIDGNRIVWGNEPGRWRDGPRDDKVFFEVVGAGAQLRIIEKHVDGSTTNQLFDRNMIQ